MKELTVIGSRCGPFRQAVRSLEDGTVDVLPLISATYPLNDALEALEHAHRPDAMKILLDMRRGDGDGGV